MGVSYTWELPRDSTAAAQARWHVREVATSAIEAADAELVVTELITNAWKHGRGEDPIRLRIEIREEFLHLEVCGQAISDPTPRKGDDDSEAGGRGLLLIEGLVDRWGYERDGDVLCVWADVAGN